MVRSVLAAPLFCVLTCGVSARGGDDPVRQKLDDVRAAYEAAIEDYQRNVQSWFEGQDATARKVKSGVAAKVKQVAAERKEFDESGKVPSRFPVTIKGKRAKAADSMIKAYNAASETYYKQKQDEEAANVEKELEDFKKGIAGNAELPRGPFQTKSVWMSDSPRRVLTVTARKEDAFRARFEVADAIVRDVTGTIKDGKLSWFAKDVHAVKGGVGADNHGTITSDGFGAKIDFVWRGENGASGTFTLRLIKGR